MHYCNRNTKDLKPLCEGDSVHMQPFELGTYKEWAKGNVVKRLDHRSYEIQSGHNIYRRNRVHLKKTVVPEVTSPKQNSVDEKETKQPEIDMTPDSIYPESPVKSKTNIQNSQTPKKSRYGHLI